MVELVGWAVLKTGRTMVLAPLPLALLAYRIPHPAPKKDPTKAEFRAIQSLSGPSFGASSGVPALSLVASFIWSGIWARNPLKELQSSLKEPLRSL